MTDDQTQIRSTIETMTAAFQNGDIERVMASYVPGAAVLFEPGKPVDDAEVLTQMFTAMAQAKPEFTYAGHEVVVAGDTALHIAPWTMAATGPDGAAISQTGLSVAVLLRQDDGSWRMIIDNPHGGRLIPNGSN